MRLIFTHRQAITAHVTTFTFRPAEAVSWLAGQSIRLEIPAPDYGSNERRFTISSTPYEELISITTQFSSSEFKQSLFALNPGDEINGYAIEGDFIWKQSVDPLVFVAGGIGITPFYAMLKQRLHDGQPIAATLFYGSHSRELAFLPELQLWQRKHAEFIVHAFKAPVSGHMLEQFLPTTQAVFYLSGAQNYIQQLQTELINFNAASIKTDLFTGRIKA